MLPFYAGTSRHHVGQTFTFSKDVYYLLRLKLGLVYQQQLQQEGRLVSTLAKCRCGDVYSREVIISVNNSLGNKEGGLPPPGHITISQMSKKTWYKVKDGWSESEVRCL